MMKSKREILSIKQCRRQKKGKRCQANATIKDSQTNQSYCARHYTIMLEERCDNLWAQIITKRGSCEKCGTSQNLQASHIFSKRKKSTRWNPENGFCLCLNHHLFWWHREPIEAFLWAEEMLGTEKIEELRKSSQQLAKGIDLDKIQTSLERELSE